MGLLDQVLGGMLGSSSGGGRGNSPVMDALMALLRSQGGGGMGGLGGLLGGSDGNNQVGGRMAPQGQSGMGGLGGLLEQFTRSGHGDIANSWVETGENRPIQSHQLEEALGANTIDQLSRQTGMRRDELLRELSNHLPQAVDRLTPDGRLPSHEQMNHW